jgi:hypothetical protein
MKEENTDESYIGLICNGEFNAIHDFKIGELFESFFDNINYNVVREENSIYVDFTGEAICDDEPCTILIRFKIDDNGDEFEVNKVKVNEDILDEEETLDLLDDIAFAGGAILDDEDYCYNCDAESCEHCMHGLEDDNDEDEEDDDNDDENK